MFHTLEFLVAMDASIENMIDSLEQDAIQLATCYPANYMKLNVDKCHLMIFGEKSRKIKIHIGEAVIEEIDEGTLLGITLDTKLSFKSHDIPFAEKQARMHAYLEFRFLWIQKDKIDDDYLDIVTF